jgi:hypothetical protein
MEWRRSCDGGSPLSFPDGQECGVLVVGSNRIVCFADPAGKIVASLESFRMFGPVRITV